MSLDRGEPEAGSTGCRNSAARAVAWAGPVILLWACIVLPSVTGAVWGSLDDGATLVMSRANFHAWLTTPAGRMLPVFWIRCWLLYRIGGTDPFLWYLLQALGFLLASFFLYAAVGILTGRWAVGALAGSLFLTSSPVAENVYTISKCEPVLVFFFTLTVLLIVLTIREPEAGSGRTRSIARLAAGLALPAAVFMMMFSKESALMLAAMGPVGLVLALARGDPDRRRAAVRGFLYASILLTAAGAALLAARTVAMRGVENAYTDFTPSWHASVGNAKFYLTQSSDLILLAGGCLVASLVSVPRLIRARDARRHTAEAACAVVLGSSTLAAGLTYYLLLVIWREKVSYYTLPVAACLALSYGFFAGALPGITAAGKNPVIRAALAILVVAAASGRLFSLPYLHFVANAQRGFDRLEDAAAGQALILDPPRKRIIDIERASFVEQPFQRNLLYAVAGRPDFKWIGAAEACQSFPKEMRVRFGHPEPASPAIPTPESGDLLYQAACLYPFQIELRGIGPRVREADHRRQCMQIWESRSGRPLRTVWSDRLERRVCRPWTLERRLLRMDFEIRRVTAPGEP